MDTPAITIDIDLDRSNPTPLYFQIAEQIEVAINDGKLSPGTRLENEAVLSGKLGLSRPTVRRAIQHLVDKGLLVRKRGVGTQVVHGQVTRAARLTSLYDDLVRAGQEPTTQVLKLSVEPPPPDVASALGMDGNAEVLAIERLRGTIDGPLALLRNWLPVGLVDLTEEMLTRRGLYQIMRSAGVNLRVASQEIGACVATATQARMLSEHKGAPLLTMTRTTYDDVGRAVEHGSDLYRAGRYTFQTTLVDR